MKKEIFKSACLLFIALFTFANVLAQSSGDIKRKIEKLNKEMATAAVEGNYEKNLTFYTDDAISMPNSGKMAEGKEAIRKSNEEMMKSGAKIQSFDSKTSKVMECGNQITEIGTYKITLTMPGMEKPIEDNGKYLTIWEKQSDGSLKIKLEIWNTDVNYMEMDKKM